MRDSQRAKVYKAELEALRQDHPQNTKFEDMADVEKYLRWLIQRAPVQARYKRELFYSVHVKAGKGCHATYNTITIAKWGRSKDVICHELAHIIIGRHFPRKTVQDHGREFCKVYIDLVHFGMGADAADDLKESFRKHKVKFTKAKPKVVKVMTPEAREAMLARLAAARDVRLKKQAVRIKNVVNGHNLLPL